jgi:hypothetical protein
LGLKQEVLDYLTRENRGRHQHLQIYDSITWTDEKLLPHLTIKHTAQTATAHPTCSMHTLGIDANLRKIATALQRTERRNSAGQKLCMINHIFSGGEGIVTSEVEATDCGRFGIEWAPIAET